MRAILSYLDLTGFCNHQVQRRSQRESEKAVLTSYSEDPASIEMLVRCFILRCFRVDVLSSVWKASRNPHDQKIRTLQCRCGED